MPYRQSEHTRQRLREVRARILDAAQALVREGGYGTVEIDAIARRARVASGTVYRHFPSKADLMAEVFRTLSAPEVARMAAALGGPGSAADRICDALVDFSRRALRGRRVAYALLAEPVDVSVDAERLVFRRAYASHLARAIRDGVRRRELPPQDPDFTAAALVGALGEALLGPLSLRRPPRSDQLTLSRVAAFCRRAITGQETTPHGHARGLQPAAAARGVRPGGGRRRAGRGHPPRGRRVGAGPDPEGGRAGHRAGAGLGLPGEPAPAGAAHA